MLLCINMRRDDAYHHPMSHDDYLYKRVLEPLEQSDLKRFEQINEGCQNSTAKHNAASRQ